MYNPGLRYHRHRTNRRLDRSPNRIRVEDQPHHAMEPVW